MSKNKEAVGNLGEEELNFLRLVRQSRQDTRRDADALFKTAPQNRERDIKLMNKLFVQAPGAITMADNLLKNASAEEFEKFEKMKIAYNVYAFFDGGFHYSPAQRRYPELLKVAKSRPAVVMKKTPDPETKTGNTSGGRTLSGAID
jgi:hypothetical protein